MQNTSEPHQAYPVGASLLEKQPCQNGYWTASQRRSARYTFSVVPRGLVTRRDPPAHIDIKTQQVIIEPRAPSVRERYPHPREPPGGHAARRCDNSRSPNSRWCHANSTKLKSSVTASLGQWSHPGAADERKALVDATNIILQVSPCNSGNQHVFVQEAAGRTKARGQVDSFDQHAVIHLGGKAQMAHT